MVSLAYIDMASGHTIERSSMSHIDDVIGMMAYLENILMAVTIGGGIVLKDRVITRRNYEECFHLSGSSGIVLD